MQGDVIRDSGPGRWRRLARLALLTMALGLATPLEAARQTRLELRHQRLTLPGPPAALIDADLNGDGRPDLAIVLAYTEIETIGVDRIEDMVQFSTVIPALFDRRELHAFLADPAGKLVPVAAPLPLPESVLALARGPRGDSLLALTDDGISEVRLSFDGEPALTIEPRIAAVPLLRGSRTFFSTLEWVRDVDGDGEADAIFPGVNGAAVHLSRNGRLVEEPADSFALPGDRRLPGAAVRREVPFPQVHDVTGDGRADLVFTGRGLAVDVLAGNGDGTFRPLHAAAALCPAAASRVPLAGPRGNYLGELAWFGDLDGDGRGELVTMEEILSGKDGLRAGMREAKRPRNRFRVHRLRDDMAFDPEPIQDFIAEGHSFEDVDIEAAAIGLFQDLDGDGRRDLITVTLEFSVLQAVRILATKKISVGLDFHVWAQQPDGSFREVPGLDLSEKLRFDLNDLQLGRLAQFKGDFDGDGRIDFVHLGRGKQVTIHRGQPGCRYPTRPDLAIELAEEPQDMGLVRVADFDGDGRADLAVIRALEATAADVTAPVELDLYLSGGVAR